MPEVVTITVKGSATPAIFLGKNIIPDQYQKGYLRFVKVEADGRAYLAFKPMSRKGKK